MKYCIIPDTHIEHDNMVHLCGRPTDFSEQILENWQAIDKEMETVPVPLGKELIDKGREFFAKYDLSLEQGMAVILEQALFLDNVKFPPTPNAETLAALAEYEEMKANPDKYKRYNSFKEIMEELNNDD